MTQCCSLHSIFAAASNGQAWQADLAKTINGVTSYVRVCGVGASDTVVTSGDGLLHLKYGAAMVLITSLTNNGHTFVHSKPPLAHMPDPWCRIEKIRFQGVKSAVALDSNGEQVCILPTDTAMRLCREHPTLGN